MKLYYSPGASSLSPHIALREADLAFEPVLASTKTATNSPENSSDPCHRRRIRRLRSRWSTVGDAPMFPEQGHHRQRRELPGPHHAGSGSQGRRLGRYAQVTGPFTVFAPTNAAFAALPAGTVDTLLNPENKPMLTG